MERLCRLYSVYSKKDDSLVILDGTVEECCVAMKLRHKTSFYPLINQANGKWLIIESDREQIRKDMNS